MWRDGSPQIQTRRTSDSRRCSAWNARRAAIAGSSGSIPAARHIATSIAQATACPSCSAACWPRAAPTTTAVPLPRSLAPHAAARPGAPAGHGEGRGALRRSHQGSEPIAVFGDYDVDGAASVALIERFLRAHGQTPATYIPDRLTEGYGPSAEALDRPRQGGRAPHPDRRLRHHRRARHRRRQ